MKTLMLGAVRSRTIWVNVALMTLSGLELMSSHITTIAGPKVAAGLVMLGALTNIGLRAYTTMSLTQKGRESIAKSDG